MSSENRPACVSKKSGQTDGHPHRQRGGHVLKAAAAAQEGISQGTESSPGP